MKDHTSIKNTEKKMVPGNILFAFILLTGCFTWWGLANNMTDTLLAAFKKIMSMSDFQTSWIQIAFYGSYFCLAFPAAVYIKKYTYKSGVLLGLGLFIACALLFYPASRTMNYFHFLAALYILAGGLSILETSANPYIISMGPEETATRRLNLAQSFNPIGSILGVLLSKFFILSNLHEASADDRALIGPEQLAKIQADELNAVMGPYVSVALFLVVIWIIMARIKMPKAADEGIPVNLKATFRRLIRNKNYLTGVAAQFFYVGAQIGVWSFTIRFVMHALGINEEQESSYYLAALILFTGGRFVCTWLMRFIAPGNLLTMLSGAAIVCTFIVIFSGGYKGVIALVAISACMSLMFPTIFGLAVKELGEDTKIGGSGLIMAILGGAVLTALQGQVSDLTGSINLAYLVPLGCFTVILLYGYSSKTKKIISCY